MIYFLKSCQVLKGLASGAAIFFVGGLLKTGNVNMSSLEVLRRTSCKSMPTTCY